MAIKRMQMYRRNLDGTETRLNPLTEAQYVSMENGQTVQEILSDRDSDKYTPVITNSSSTFKVGQGDNVDLSSSMKEGAYDSCVLKGKTMVNCIQESSSKDIVLPYEFADGQSVTISDTKESGALGVELKGQTLVNIHDKKTPSLAAAENDWYSNLVIETNSISFTVAKLPENWRYINFKSLNLSMLKPNTKYLVAFEEASGVSTVTFKNGDSTHPLSDTVQIVSNKAIVTTTSDWVNSAQILYIYVPAKNVGAEVKVKNPMIIEYVEGMENWDIPYFEGMTSCKMPILSTVGKNLFDGGIKNGSNLHINTGIEESGTRTIPLNFTKVKPNTTYTFSRPLALGAIGLRFYDKDKNYIKHGSTSATTSITFTTPNQCYYIKWVDEANKTTEGYQIECGSPTSYESHKSSILSLPEEVVLRSLPNGVCDTFNTRTGVYTQNVKEVTFNGSENWIKGVRSDTTVVSMFYLQLEDLLTNAEGDINDLFIDKIFTSQSHVIWDRDVEGIHNKRSCLYININNSRMSDVTIEAFKTWLSQNPITVQYQLVEPIITKINLPSTLKSWNTTTHIHSEIPENTLYPTLSHSNPTYPVILKPSTKYSIVANSYSNNHTNSTINFNLGGATASTTVGNRVTTITTPSTLSNELLTMSGRGNKLNNVMVIEGDVVGDEPYFEGICDCKTPILSNVGKNLFDYKNYGKQDINIVEIENGLRVSTWATSLPFINNLLPNTKYTSKSVVKVVEEQVGATDIGAGKIYIYNGTNYFLLFKADGGKYVFTTPSDIKSYNRILFYAHGGGGSKVGVVDITNIQLEETSSATTYEPYKSNTTTFEQKDGKTIVLRSLPNGVCDTLNVETGEYVQRIGERTLNGSEDWGVWQQGGDHLAQKTVVGFGLNLDDAPTTKNFYVLCDHFATGGTTSGANNDHTYYVYHKELIYGYYANASTHHRLGLSVSKTKLGIPNDNTNATQALAGLRTYLASNPVTVQYELATPIVSTIDVQGFPYAYTNGHVQLSSGHNGQSLTPKVEYSLSANKTGQINSNTKRVSTHQKQLDDFEAMMLTSMVQSAYDKAILQFDYEMQMMSLGGE